MILRPIISPLPSSPDYFFFCPGCKACHGVWVTKQNEERKWWTWNGDKEKPTFTPSFSNEPAGRPRCHADVKDGQIAFRKTSTHPLAGQTVPLPHF